MRTNTMKEIPPRWPLSCDNKVPIFLGLHIPIQAVANLKNKEPEFLNASPQLFWSNEVPMLCHIRPSSYFSKLWTLSNKVASNYRNLSIEQLKPSKSKPFDLYSRGNRYDHHRIYFDQLLKWLTFLRAALFNEGSTDNDSLIFKVPSEN